MKKTACKVLSLLCAVVLLACAIPATALAAYLGAPFLLVFAITYMVEDWPKCVCCLIHFRKGGWIKPVTEEGRAGLEAYRAELAAK